MVQHRYTINSSILPFVRQKTCFICGGRFKLGDEVISKRNTNHLTHLYHAKCAESKNIIVEGISSE